MKDEYDVNDGDKLVVGCKMKTVCRSVAIGNPEKTPSVDVLFNHDSILKRLNLYNAYRVIHGRVKRGPGKGRTRVIMVVPSRSMALERASRRFKANIKKHDGSLARVLLEDVIGRKPGMYRKKVS